MRLGYPDSYAPSDITGEGMKLRYPVLTPSGKRVA